MAFGFSARAFPAFPFREAVGAELVCAAEHGGKATAVAEDGHCCVA